MLWCIHFPDSHLILSLSGMFPNDEKYCFDTRNEGYFVELFDMRVPLSLVMTQCQDFECEIVPTSKDRKRIGQKDSDEGHHSPPA